MKLKTSFIVFATLLLIPFSGKAENHSRSPIYSFVIGGYEAEPGTWPFMTVLFERDNLLEDGQLCGGTLIAPKWVLTAAHCVEDRQASEITAAFGIHDITTDTGEQINIAQIIVHPSFNPLTFDYDIALLKLESESSYQPARLVEEDSNLTGVLATAMGWGLTDPEDWASTSEVLIQVDLPIVSQTACKSVMGSSAITPRMLCAGYLEGGRDSCNGDSGGPLVIDGDDSWEIAGIVSWGDGCALPDTYGVYTRVSEFIRWIQHKTGQLNLDPPPPATESSIYGLWNGYLSMVNVLELENFSSNDSSTQIYIFMQDGTHAATVNETIPPYSKKDLLLADYYGFNADSYGVIRVDGSVRGRIFYYRPLGQGFSNFDFAFGVELGRAMSGTSYVSFNTFQPSNNPLDSANLVANWLSIVNLGNSNATFTVNKYNNAGVKLSETSRTISSLSRLDLDGGHINPGAQNVGLLKIVPLNSETQYLSQLTRYGYGSDNNFDFAFPLIATTGDNQLYAAISSMAGIQNWLEVVNISDVSSNVTVKFFNHSGIELNSTSVALPARSQMHFDASGILGPETVGHAEITTNAGVIAAQSMYYFRNSTNGSISTMYGSQARAASSNILTGSYNLFLGMYNYLKLVNTTTEPVEVDLVVSSLLSTGSSHTYTLPAKSSLDLGLHEHETFGTLSDTYGALLVEPRGGEIITEVLRLKPTADGSRFQFVAPTDVR